MAAERVRPPAEAYYEVANWLGDAFFTSSAPESGTQLIVMGRDQVETVWRLDGLTASRMAEWVHSQPGLAVLSRCKFDRDGLTR